jgi:hypothetical protein
MSVFGIFPHFHYSIVFPGVNHPLVTVLSNCSAHPFVWYGALILIFRSTLDILETLHRFRAVAERAILAIISHCRLHCYGIVAAVVT